MDPVQEDHKDPTTLLVWIGVRICRREHFSRWAGSSTIKHVRFLDNDTQWDEDLFRDLPALETVHAPNTLLVVTSRCFFELYHFREVTHTDPVTGHVRVGFPDSVFVINESACEGCHEFTFDNLPFDLTRIGKGAFIHCKLPEVLTLPEKCDKIDDQAFLAATGVKTLNLGPNTTLGKNAFYGCSDLVQVNMGDSLQVPPSIIARCFAFTPFASNLASSIEVPYV